MAITFSNTIYDDIMESLSTIINDEFSVPVYYDEHKPPQSFILRPVSDELVANLSSGMERAYTIEINYQLKIAVVNHYYLKFFCLYKFSKIYL